MISSRGRGLDDAQLASIVLGSLEHFPQYRDRFHTVSVRAVAHDPRYAQLARSMTAPSDAEAAVVVATAFQQAAAAMGAPAGAAELVARSLVAAPANARAVLAAGAAALGAHEATFQRVAAHEELSANAAGVVARGTASMPARDAIAIARAAAGSSAHPTEAPPCVYVHLPVDAGPQAWRAGLYVRVDDAVYRRVAQRLEVSQESYLFWCAVEHRGALWLVGSQPRRDAAGLASGYDPASRPEDVRAPWYTTFDGATWRELAGVQVAALAPAAAAALAQRG